jgi:hypothetical protein
VLTSWCGRDQPPDVARGAVHSVEKSVFGERIAQAGTRTNLIMKMARGEDGSGAIVTGPGTVTRQTAAVSATHSVSDQIAAQKLQRFKGNGQAPVS